MFEVRVPYSNRQVFGNRKPRQPSNMDQGCIEWLDRYGGDWGLENCWGLEFNSEMVFEPKDVIVGKIFQFEDSRTASLFFLIFQYPKERHRHVKDAN